MGTEGIERQGSNKSGSSLSRRGRLLALPEDAGIRAAVLEVIIAALDPSRTYAEDQVNDLCAEWQDDWRGLRRVLVEEGFLVRDRNGSSYRRASPAPESP